MTRYGKTPSALTYGITVLLILFGFHAMAQRSTEPSPCYDANDPRDLRLWDGNAPGAVGADPCRDIPFLRIYRPKGAAPATDTGMIVMPGGGYDRLTDTKEQSPVGRYFADQVGITTFVLYYRLVQPNGTYRYPVPMWDGQRAIRLVRSRAAQFGMDPRRIGVFGFSAGGHLASTTAIHFANNFDLPSVDAVDRTDARPSFLGLGYPVISMDPNQYASPSSLGHLLDGYAGAQRDQLETYLSGQKEVKASTPPTFLFESLDDKRISPENSTLFAQALQAARVRNDVHMFQHGLHGAGLAVDQPEESVWPSLFLHWLEEQGFLAKRR